MFRCPKGHAHPSATALRTRDAQAVQASRVATPVNNGNEGTPDGCLLLVGEAVARSRRRSRRGPPHPASGAWTDKRSSTPASSITRRTGPGPRGHTIASARPSRASAARARSKTVSPLPSTNDTSHRSRTNAPVLARITSSRVRSSCGLVAMSISPRSVRPGASPSKESRISISAGRWLATERFLRSLDEE